MPLQHISDKMLASMRRGTTREKTNALIKTIREKVPGIALRTTLIAGFPGETQADFEELKNWVIETRFDRLGIFTYSHEEQTHAYKLNDDVPAATKRRRADKIMEVQQEISRQINTQKIGKTFRVMVDRQEGDFLICRTEHDSPEVDNEVLVASEFGLIPGSFANIKITSADDYDLHGIPC
jgi:ribosomal protein S12 methylthiotransferase